jgi:hypothetical protein
MASSSSAPPWVVTENPRSALPSPESLRAPGLASIQSTSSAMTLSFFGPAAWETGRAERRCRGPVAAARPSVPSPLRGASRRSSSRAKSRFTKGTRWAVAVMRRLPSVPAAAMLRSNSVARACSRGRIAPATLTHHGTLPTATHRNSSNVRAMSRRLAASAFPPFWSDERRSSRTMLAGAAPSSCGLQWDGCVAPASATPHACGASAAAARAGERSFSCACSRAAPAETQLTPRAEKAANQLRAAQSSSVAPKFSTIW